MAEEILCEVEFSGDAQVTRESPASHAAGVVPDEIADLYQKRLVDALTDFALHVGGVQKVRIRIIRRDVPG